ncbi:phenylalanine--tRNA ligase subunit beta [Campylobacter sp. MIT 99-7217]|uniref:phenylalanine--tRNA ligase subunit beta n=1 Tax=Campylobacter sp. MIT 99-7217 TaxID=535091 RepID=UPI00115C207C|nr:phenylalanine--tRNA ligase subunit beta [Campylobacter sp. MIT 99-7217]TQR34607.1 phenylalanine--tRNA ligase subunit beta [Campylobacter sp. MIT 99-7217]
MIITRTWLSEFIDISEKTLQDLVQTLNSIGIEVDKAHSLKVPDKVVVGFVKEKIKHENSDKLSICKVDVGEEDLQIVCGAKNVDEGQFVAVALVGAKLGDTSIKKTKLRGVESFGMICSSTELGFAKLCDGIMILDDSMGELITGKALNAYPLFNDDFIEVELTPNRGDCLSVYGIARDLSAAYDIDMKKRKDFVEPENSKGIGRMLRLSADKELNSSFKYRIIEFKNPVVTSLLLRLRLATIENLGENDVINFLNYATHATGVIFNAYDFKTLEKDQDEELIFKITKEKNGESKVYHEDKLLNTVGIYQEECSKLDQSQIIIIESSYTIPKIIAQAKPHYKKIDENIFYRSFRGSEPKLDIGMNYLINKISKYDNISIYTGSQHIQLQKSLQEIKITASEVSKIIGKDIDKNDIVRILKRLEFEVFIVDENLINVKVPMHRSDVENLYDICEEIVRIVGIDNIASKALEFKEQTRINDTYKEYLELKKLRSRAVALGYFESVHYVLDSKEELVKLGFSTSKLKLSNPLNSDLDTLRPTLINHLLNAANLNISNGKKSVKLFESGAVFNYETQEIHKIAFLNSGLKEEAKISNKAKPKTIDFYDFLFEIQSIIGKFELKQSKEDFLSPYEQAFIYQNGVNLGFVGRVHLKIEKERNLPKTYLCEINLYKLKFKEKVAKPYSKFPSISRDLSILVPKNLSYEPIKELITKLKIPNLQSFRITDLYSDESLSDYFSLSINFIFQNLEKTLEDSEINEAMQKILDALKKDLGLNLR